MKITYLLTCLLLVGLISTSSAQNQLKPGYKMTLSVNSLEVKAGTSSEFTVNLERFKSYTKSKAKLYVNKGQQEGISVSFSPAEGVFNSSTATVTVSESVKPGSYQLILNAEINREVKGAIIKITVPEGKASNVVSSMND